jgi:hypothetical protein
MFSSVLARARATSQADAIRDLTRIGPPDKDGQYYTNAENPYEFADGWMEYFGGELFGKQSTNEIERWLKTQPVYAGHWDQWNAGYPFSSEYVYRDPVV